MTTSSDSEPRLGAWTETFVVQVRTEHLARYAAATNEPPGPAHEQLRPPLFGAVLLGDAVTRAMHRLLPHDLSPGAQPLHGEHDMTIYQAIAPGMQLHTRAIALGAHPRASGSTFVVKSVTRDDAGAPINEQYWTAFLPGVVVERPTGQAAPPRPRVDRERPPLARVSDRLDPDQTYRYAEASGDHTPIHLDAHAAQRAGLPGIIAHGLCTLAFASRAVVLSVADGDATRVRRIGVRFARPAFPGQGLTTTIRRDSVAIDHHAVFLFETCTDDGDLVLKDGLVAITI